jgi:DNA-binding GntR family transcriptional regulator
VTPDEMRDAYQLRARLEEFAAELAVPVAAADIAGLAEIAEATVVAARRGAVDLYAQHNFQFHRRILELSGNAVLLRTWEALGWPVRMAVAAREAREHLDEAAAQHHEVVAALRKGRGSDAGRLLRQHAESFLQAAEAAVPARQTVHKTVRKARRARD